MTERAWFLTSVEFDADGGRQPMVPGDVEATACQPISPDRYIVAVYTTAEEIAVIEEHADTTRVPESAIVSYLNGSTGLERTAAEWADVWGFTDGE